MLILDVLKRNGLDHVKKIGALRVSGLSIPSDPESLVLSFSMRSNMLGAPLSPVRESGILYLLYPDYLGDHYRSAGYFKDPRGDAYYWGFSFNKPSDELEDSLQGTLDVAKEVAVYLSETRPKCPICDMRMRRAYTRGESSKYESLPVNGSFWQCTDMNCRGIRAPWKVNSDPLDGAEAPREAKCPKCGYSMKWRLCRRGPNKGNHFLGCSRYPDCDGLYPAEAALAFRLME